MWSNGYNQTRAPFHVSSEDSIVVLCRSTSFDILVHTLYQRGRYINSSLPIVSLAVTGDSLIYSSASAACSSRAGGEPQAALGLGQSMNRGSLNYLDFGAAPDQLADAACPFSSTFDDIAGYRYNDLLETVYDDVDPDRLG